MNRRVLLVDDDDLIREVATAALELVAGWTVLTASSGAQAIEVARREQPDAILMDVMMPGMDGPTAVVELQDDQLTKDIPTILLTAKVQPGDRRNFQQLPLAGVITKPFDPMTLATTVRHLLGWREPTEADRAAAGRTGTARG
ncbi:CheY-like chemotaxis protein [Friedmanniella endophytica]|uniref:CheY-like chemotaxis protein n=1 Tax=Microlunatus kandeliicorticis TaxID=1759536 RepID=A0A7W3IQ35_9ACTN|nr:response regulator [Microlunatus kandeliicorticis]MBA8793174.1 CheY-like chemotaxis protein [Microlunatus kandeliicorticis]